MVRPDLVARKVARAAGWLDDAEPVLARPPEVLRADRPARDLATFYLFLAIQECIGLAAHWVADEGWPPPDDAASTFDLLGERGVIPPEVASGMRAATALRNRIAHGYASVDHVRLGDDAAEGIPVLRRFLAAVASAAGC